MMVFDLHCTRGHTFEEWFLSAADCDEKMAAHDVICPDCGDHDVVKALSAPRLNTGSVSGQAAETPCAMPACGMGGCPMMNGG